MASTYTSVVVMCMHQAGHQAAVKAPTTDAYCSGTLTCRQLLALVPDLMAPLHPGFKALIGIREGLVEGIKHNTCLLLCHVLGPDPHRPVLGQRQNQQQTYLSIGKLFHLGLKALLKLLAALIRLFVLVITTADLLLGDSPFA